MADFQSIFNSKKHCDLRVVVGKETFYLHKFPLVAKSAFFDDATAEGGAGGRHVVHLHGFPGGADTFQRIARYCYGFDLSLNPDTIAHIYCGARYLRMEELEDTTERYMVVEVLPSQVAAARVLKHATQIVYQSETIMVDVVGRCINAVAYNFSNVPELNELPPDCFACVLRTARELGAASSEAVAAASPSRRSAAPPTRRDPAELKIALEEAAVQYIRARLTTSTTEAGLTGTQLQEVLQAPGPMDRMEYAGEVYSVVEVMLDRLTQEQVEDVCFALHGMGFWVWLSHDVLERAYADRRVPDRYCTVALMAENRRLLSYNSELETRVRKLTRALRRERQEAYGARGAGGGVDDYSVDDEEDVEYGEEDDRTGEYEGDDVRAGGADRDGRTSDRDSRLPLPPSRRSSHDDRDGIVSGRSGQSPRYHRNSAHADSEEDTTLSFDDYGDTRDGAGGEHMPGADELLDVDDDADEANYADDADAYGARKGAGRAGDVGTARRRARPASARGSRK